MSRPDAGIDTGERLPLRTPARVQDVDILDPFWRAQQEQNRRVALPGQLAHMRDRGNFRALSGEWNADADYTPHAFWDSDLAKWIEAASYSLATHWDPDLDREVEEIIDLLERAQQPDGYLNSYFTTVGAGRRFTDHLDAHELYCAGHLIEAAVAHAESTGRRRLLEIACRYADLIDERFADDGPDAGGYDGHPEIELALMRLAHATGIDRYRDLAARLVENRGQQPPFFDLERQRRGTPGMFEATFPGRLENPRRYDQYQQSHLPVREQREAVGHAVRAVYLYTGATDVALETGDEQLAHAVRELWTDVTERKMHVTGHIGTVRAFESFDVAYALPTANGYGETCASIGLANWAERLGNGYRDAHYFDVLERELYNGALSGKSTDGLRYFYDNQLSSDGTLERQDWFATSCCPPNLARFVASLGRLIYSSEDALIAINLFLASRYRADIDGEPVVIEQHTDYPRSGGARLKVTTATPRRFVLAVRIPPEVAGVRLDGAAIDPESLASGYLQLDREWSGTTTVTIDFAIPVRVLRAASAVADTRGKVAVQRGPIVYCAEEIDVLAPTAELVVEPGHIDIAPDSVSGQTELTVAAVRRRTTNGLYTSAAPEEEPLLARLVPYYFWGNRGRGSMDVWLVEAIQVDDHTRSHS